MRSRRRAALERSWTESGRKTAGYVIEPKNKFLEANRSIVEYELRPGNTVTFINEVDLSEIEKWRRQADPEQRPSYTSFVVKAVAVSLRDHPYANRRLFRRPLMPFSRSRLQRFHRCDVAVACERNLPAGPPVTFIDVFRDADSLSLQQINAGLRSLAACDESNNRQWRQFSGIIRNLPLPLSKLLIRLPVFFPSLWTQFRGGAVLISSPAKYGVETIIGTWTHPLGISFGLVKERPVVRSGRVVACPTMSLTLNFDRRVIDGAHAARFFARLVEVLERPLEQIDEKGISPIGLRDGNGSVATSQAAG